jgi:hypothetical protein
MAVYVEAIGDFSNDARDVRQLYPEGERLQHLSDEARAVVSEPLADLPGCGAKSRPPQR